MNLPSRVLTSAILPAVSSIVGLLTIPVIARTSGIEIWSTIAVSQSVGLTFGGLVSFGWIELGPNRVASTQSLHALKELVRMSVQMRLIVFVLMAAPATFVALHLGSAAMTSLGIVTTLAFLSQGLDSSWFYFGLGRPGLAGLIEALPKAVVTVASLVMIRSGVSAEIYPTLVFASSAASLIGLWIWCCVGTTNKASWLPLRDMLLLNFPVAVSHFVASISASAVVAVVGFWPGAPVAEISALEKIRSAGITGMSGLMNGFLSWISASSVMQDRWRRGRIAVLFVCVAGSIVCAGYLFVFPYVLHVLLGVEPAAGAESARLLSPLALLATGLVSTVNIGLSIPLNLARESARVVTVGGVVMIVCVGMAGGLSLGWVLASMVLVSLVELALLALLILRSLRSDEISAVRRREAK